MTPMPEFRVSEAYTPTGDQPQAIDDACRVDPRRRPVSDAAGGDRHRQDGHDGLDRRADSEADARDRAQQDARRAALQRVPRVPPAERRRVLRLLLRLLPARGVRPPGGSLHREGRVDQRRHRPAPPCRDRGAPGAQGRADRRLRVLHLRHRLAGRVRGEDGGARRRARDRPRRHAPEARRHPVRAQRLDPRPRALPRAGRRRRGAAGAHGVGLPDLLLRGRGRVHLALRPALGRDLRPPRPPRHLPGDPVRHLARDDRALGGGDPPRAGGAGQALRVAGEAARGPPDPPADRVRPGDAPGARLLQRDRELLARSSTAARRGRRRTRCSTTSAAISSS